MLIASTFSHNFLHFFADFSTIKPPSLFFCTNPTVYIDHLSPLLILAQIIYRVFHTCAKLFDASLLFSLIHHSYSSFILFCYFYFLFHNNRTLLFAKNTFYFKIYYLIKPLAKISNIKNRTNFPSSFFHPPPKTEHPSIPFR